MTQGARAVRTERGVTPLDAPISSSARSALELPSASSRTLLGELRAVARFDSVTVCLVGPSGTGKTLYAEEVHRSSPRRDGPLVRMNLAAVDNGLAGSELLGHVEGAFTGARGRRLGGLLSANHGTLVLDEVTKAPIQVQHILLSLLDRNPIRPVGSDREVIADVRFVALTSVPLEEAVRSGALIPDLFERLKVFVHVIAPLNQRRDDVPAVMEAAVLRHAPAFGYDVAPMLDHELIAEVQRWPLTGNHRELDGLVQRLLVNADGAELIHRGHLPRSSSSEGGATLQSRQECYVQDQLRELRRAFATVRDEAKHYQVSVATIHRWRKELRTSGERPAH